MPVKITFKVKRNESGTAHEVTATVPTYDEATEEMRRRAWEIALSGSSARVTAQAALRKALKNGVKPGDDLNNAATDTFDRILNGKPAGFSEPTATIDRKAEPFKSMSDEQFQAMLDSIQGSVNVLNWK